uniref:Disease resistance N-terminal domain-containing protein n=1 Tax=Oryza nivara TaxID=4536 RepID=A0A0E0FJK4_ORYNI
MDALLAAVASDLVGRLISFLSSKCQEHRAGDDGASRLQRALLRARVVMEEAEGRQVTSPAMLRQLRRLRWEMCRAAYALDALRIRTAAAVVVAAAGASRCCSAWAPKWTLCSRRWPATSRLISFLISKWQEHRAGDDDGASRLQRALLRARVVMEEAEGRQVTSPVMLLQLRRLSWEMCRAAYALDALRIRAAAAAAASRRRRRRCQPLLLSLGGDGDVATAVESLEAALGGAKELVVLLAGCPRLSRQPYSAYLFMERCMFGRQMEKEQIVDFLLRPACSSAGDPNPGVLPVVGGPEVGKRTLVEHVCIDERVRQYFAKIHRLSSDDLMAAGDDDEHRRFGIDPSSRSLVVVDVIGDVDEEPWRRLCSSVRRENGDGKVVIICRTAEHAARLGTAPRPVTLDNLHRPELWYMFRVLAFGGADPEDRPELVAIAAELFEGVKHLAMIAAVNTQAAQAANDDEDAGGEHDADGDNAGPAHRPCPAWTRRASTWWCGDLPYHRTAAT